MAAKDVEVESAWREQLETRPSLGSVGPDAMYMFFGTVSGLSYI